MGTSESQMQQPIVNNTEFQKYLKQICYTVPKSGINKNYFDNILGNLNQFKVIQIGSTPLGDRLYDVLNAKHQNKVTPEVLYYFLTQLYTTDEKIQILLKHSIIIQKDCSNLYKQKMNLKKMQFLNYNRESRCEYTFLAYCFDEKSIQKYVVERKFIAMVMDSWERAFAVLVEQLPQEKKKQDGDLIENWSKSQEQKDLVKRAALACFKNFSRSMNNIADYQVFKSWICSENQDKIEAKYEGYSAVIQKKRECFFSMNIF